MLAYILPLLLILFTYRYTPNYNRYKFCFIVVVLFYCSGYMTGSDWRGYELFYQNASITDISSWQKERGYYVLMLIFKSLGVGFFTFTILLKSLVLAAVFYFFKASFHNIKYSLFALFVFLALQGPFLFVNAPFRNLLAIGIFLYAYTKFFSSSFKKYTLLCLLGASLHLTLLPIYLLSLILKKYKNKKFNKGLHIIYFVSVALSFTPLIFKDLFLIIDNFSSIVSGRLSHYVEDSTSRNAFTAGSIINIIFFCVIYYKRKWIGRDVYFFTIINLVFYRLYMVSTIFSRFYLYLLPFFIVSFVLIFYLTSIRKYRVLLVAYCFVILVSGVRSNYAYLPYTNYWYYLFKGDLKEYNYRSNYNLDEWYKKHGDMPWE